MVRDGSRRNSLVVAFHCQVLRVSGFEAWALYLERPPVGPRQASAARTEPGEDVLVRQLWGGGQVDLDPAGPNVIRNKM